MWELADHPGDDWKVFVPPEDLCSWLVYADESTLMPGIHRKFCEEYLLVYAIYETADENVAERFVMCNLATKSWERVQLPYGAFRWNNKLCPELLQTDSTHESVDDQVLAT